MSVIELRKVKKVYEDGARTVALHDVSLEIEPGEFVAIMGPSGSGKSTLMNIIGLLDVPTTGEYFLDGQLVGRRDDTSLAHLRRDKIGFVFQNFNLLPRLDVIQNVALPMTYAGIPAKDRTRRALELLEMVGLKKRAKNRPNQISGGETQRVAVARALANRPSLILADEPTGNLDTKSSLMVMDELKRLNQTGVTIVMITHNPELAVYADRIINVRDGRLGGQTRHSQKIDPESTDHRSTRR